MAKLIFTDELFAERTFEFTIEKTTVGRDARNSLVIHHDSISHYHCEINVYGLEVIVRDLGSKNGTFVNGVRLKNAQAQLKHAQVVRFGSVEARLDLSDDADQTETSMTAAGLFEKYDQAGDAANQPKKITVGPEMELGSGGDETDQTVVMPRGQSDVPAFGSPAPEPSGIPGRSMGWKILLAAAVIAVLGLALLLTLRQ